MKPVEKDIDFSKAKWAAAGLFTAAALIVCMVVITLAQYAITPRQALLMGGFAALLVGYGGIFNELATKQVLFRPGSWGLKTVCGGAVSMLVAIALR
ncbi:hypothetical protein [Eleftheria terrae]|uniref:hypothetical protein n=1 Tax=Eleftheria terrae TaxID=1597781 RepID=UPI00263B9565|nr:hypothetical protein [Eleftheria terrae]WKB50520.1 hypothetical protein N7L95_00290 [Eleftheria terrae]